MWVSNFEIDGSCALLGAAIKETNLLFEGYPVFSSETQEGIFVHFVGFIFGSEESKLEFLSILKSHERVMHVECTNDFLVLQILEHKETRAVYNPNILNIKPMRIGPDGKEQWAIASWNKKDLIEANKFMMKHFDGKLLKVGKRPIKNFSLLNINPKLSTQQQKALFLAIEHGYYEYPRSITLKELAKMMNISFATYHMHLRKAEKKVIPFVTKKIPSLQ